jgi:integrase
VWVTDRVPGTVALRTAHLYAHAVERYLVPTLGNRRLSRLSPTDVARMLSCLEEKGYSPSTRRMARATLKRALRFAEQEGLVDRNVAAIAEGPKVPKRDGRTLTPEQARTFVEAVRGDRLEAAYVLALTLGLRRGEVLGLRWSDLEDRGDDLLVHVRQQLLRDHQGVRLAELKTAGSRRSLPLARPAIDALEQHRVRQEAEEVVRGARWRNDAELIFTSTVGTPLDPEAFGRTVPRITKAAGLGHWSIHELRHSCASLLLAMEVPLEVVADQLGHSSIRVTKDVYGHLLPGARAKAAEAMRRVIEGDDDAPATSSAASLAARTAANDVSGALISDFVGRPGLDPGTLGLKVPCSSG